MILQEQKPNNTPKAATLKKATSQYIRISSFSAAIWFKFLRAGFFSQMHAIQYRYLFQNSDTFLQVSPESAQNFWGSEELKVHFNFVASFQTCPK